MKDSEIENKISRMADVIELRVWAMNEPFTLSSLKEEIESIIGFTDDDDDEKGESYELAMSTFEEFERRLAVIDVGYPFEIDGEMIRVDINRKDQATSYPFCLGLSLLAEIDNAMRAPHFELVALEAAKSYFAASGVKTGAPWSNAYQSYQELLEEICKVAPEFIAPKKNVKAPSGGDRGWDFVVGKPFKDSEMSQFVAFGNCATGRNDYLIKGAETTVDYYMENFEGRLRSPVFQIFAIPFVLSGDERDRKSGRERIIFDRFRICHFAPNAGDVPLQWLKSRKTEIESIAIL